MPKKIPIPFGDLRTKKVCISTKRLNKFAMLGLRIMVIVFVAGTAQAVPVSGWNPVGGNVVTLTFSDDAGNIVIGTIRESIFWEIGTEDDPNFVKWDNTATFVIKAKDGKEYSIPNAEVKKRIKNVYRNFSPAGKLRGNLMELVTAKMEEIRASHILVATGKLDERGKANAKARIEELLRKIRAGTSFEELAKKHSDCPSKVNGGDLGYFKRGKMVKKFEDVAFALEIGEISDVVETVYGYHIIKVTDRKRKKTSWVEKALPNIGSQLFDPSTLDLGTVVQRDVRTASWVINGNGWSTTGYMRRIVCSETGPRFPIVVAYTKVLQPTDHIVAISLSVGDPAPHGVAAKSKEGLHLKPLWLARSISLYIKDSEREGDLYIISSRHKKPEDFLWAVFVPISPSNHKPTPQSKCFVQEVLWKQENSYSEMLSADSWRLTQWREIISKE